jgi:phosphotransferase system  glucose/maltose/N-acetylglucosamine-specific IIC component
MEVAAIVIVIAMTVLVVVSVIGLHVWGAIQDGREQRRRERGESG